MTDHFPAADQINQPDGLDQAYWQRFQHSALVEAEIQYSGLGHRDLIWLLCF